MNILTTYTLKYLRLNRKRTAVTILGVILSSALICGVFMLGDSFRQVMIDHEIYMAGNWHAQFHGVPYAQAKYIIGNSAVQTAMFSASLGSATDGSQTWNGTWSTNCDDSANKFCIFFNSPAAGFADYGIEEV